MTPPLPSPKSLSIFPCQNLFVFTWRNHGEITTQQTLNGLQLCSTHTHVHTTMGSYCHARHRRTHWHLFRVWCWQLEPGLEPAARWTDWATATVNLNKGFLKYKMPPNTNATSFLEQQSHEQTDVFGFSLFFLFFSNLKFKPFCA